MSDTLPPHLKRVEGWTFKLLDAALTDAERADLEQALDRDPEALRLHLELMAQEGALRGQRRDLDLAPGTLSRLRDVLRAGAGSPVFDALKRAAERFYAPAEPLWSWLLGARFWAAAGAAALVVLVVVLRAVWPSQPEPITPQEAFVYGNARVAPGTPALQRAFVRDATTDAPIPGAAVDFALYPIGSTTPVWTHQATTGDDGIALASPEIPEAAKDGAAYTLQLTARSERGESVVRKTLTARPAARLWVTTDKPTYQPGQTVRMRLMASSRNDRTPLVARTVRLTVRDYLNAVVFERTLTTSAFGIAHAELPLSDPILLGRYTVQATLGDATATRSIAIERYTLPRLSVGLTTDKTFYTPDATLSASVEARYIFGEPVAKGAVKVVVSRDVAGWEPFRTAEGTTDAEGRFRFALKLGAPLVGSLESQGRAKLRVEATVTDPAGRAQTLTRILPVSEEPLMVDVVPETTPLVPNIPNTVYVVTAYPDGRPAQTQVTLNDAEPVRTSSSGVAVVQVTPTAPELTLKLGVRDADGASVTATRQLTTDTRQLAFLVRTDRAVYRAGDTAQVTVHAPGQEGAVFVDLVHAERPTTTETLTLANGRAERAITLPADLAGTIELHAYRVLNTGDLITATRRIQLNIAEELTLRATVNTPPFRPGDTVKLTVEARDAKDRPVQAALGISGVNEAVFARQAMRADRLQDDLHAPGAAPRVHIPPSALLNDAPDSAALLAATTNTTSPTRAASPRHRDRQAIMDARIRAQRDHAAYSALLILLALITLIALSTVVYGLWRTVQAAPVDAEDRARDALSATTRAAVLCWAACWSLPAVLHIVLTLILSNHVLAGGAALVFAAALIGVLARLCWRFVRHPASATAPLLRRVMGALPVLAALAWLACAAAPLAPMLSLQTLAPPALTLALVPGAVAASSASLFEASTRARRAWRAVSRAACFGVVPVACAIFAQLLTSPLFAGGESDLTPPPSAAKKGDKPQPWTASARLRSAIETLVWEPELITNAQGRAELAFTLPDMVTTWRLSMDAVTQTGAFGDHRIDLRASQPFFLDLTPPARLIEGDAVTLPLVVHNHTDAPQTVRITARASKALTLRGPGTRAIQLKPGEVRRVPLECTALKHGAHTVEVQAAGGDVRDTITRTLRVAPRGRYTEQTVAGLLRDAPAPTVTLPQGAAPDASALTVTLYPNADSLLGDLLRDALAQDPYSAPQVVSRLTTLGLVRSALRAFDGLDPTVDRDTTVRMTRDYQHLRAFIYHASKLSRWGNANNPDAPTLNADLLLALASDPDALGFTADWRADVRRSLLYDLSRQNTWTTPGQGDAASTLRTTAHVAWAVAETTPPNADTNDYPERRVSAMLNALADTLGTTQDPHTLALIAHALLASEHTDAPNAVAALIAAQSPDGSWGDLDATALAISALVRSGDAHLERARSGLAWLLNHAHAADRAHPRAAAHLARALVSARALFPDAPRAPVQLALNGALAHTFDALASDSDLVRSVTLPGALRPGPNTVALSADDALPVFYRITAAYHAPWAAPEPSARDANLKLDVRYDRARLGDDGVLGATIDVTWRGPNPPTGAVVTVPIPPGFELDPGALETLRELGRITHHTRTRHQLIVHLPAFYANIPHRLELSWRALYPVRATIPPPRVRPEGVANPREVQDAPAQVTAL